MKYLYPLFILFFVFACTQTEKPQPFLDDGITITCGLEACETNITDIVDGAIEYIPLETNSESLIGKISNIRYGQGKYFIMDEQQKSVIIFNDKGKHISTINRKGGGPCEYYDLYDMRLSRDNTVEILGSSNPLTLIQYGQNHSQCQKLQTVDKISAYQFMPIDSGYVFLQAIGAFEKDKQYFIFITDSEGKIEKKYLPSYRLTGYSINNSNNFYMLDDTVVFYMSRDKHIYQISQQGEMSIRYTVDYGKYHLPDEINKLFEKSLDQYIEQSRSYASGPGNICESHTHLYFSSVAPHVEDNCFYTFFSKKSGIVSTFQVNDILSDALLNPIAVMEDDRFISCINPAELEYESHEKYPELMSIYDTLLNKDANPILVLYKLKSL
jgi:hypothetical protein